MIAVQPIFVSNTNCTDGVYLFSLIGLDGGSMVEKSAKILKLPVAIIHEQFLRPKSKYSRKQYEQMSGRWFAKEKERRFSIRFESL